MGSEMCIRDRFHIGGAAQRGAEQSSVEASFDATVKINNRNVVIDRKKMPVVMARNTEIVLVDEQGRERASYRVPYGSKLLKDDGDNVERGDRLAEWDPYTRPIISEKEGTANYMDLVDGVSMRDITDEATGLSYKTVIEWKQQPKGADLRPRITLRDSDGEVITLESGAEARYFLSVDAILSVEAGQRVHAGDVLARIRSKDRKPVILPVVYHVWLNYSKHVSQKITRLSVNLRVQLSLVKIINLRHV